MIGLYPYSSTFIAEVLQANGEQLTMRMRPKDGSGAWGQVVPCTRENFLGMAGELLEPPEAHAFRSRVLLRPALLATLEVLAFGRGQRAVATLAAGLQGTTGFELAAGDLDGGAA